MYAFRNVILCLLCTLIFTANTNAQTNSKPEKIIFIIGDGMGLTQISSLYVDKTITNFERFKTIGLVKTGSATHKITDSAAGATAYSTGKKTYNYAIGVNKDTVPEITLIEQLKEKGFNTGIVVTSSVTHATPAAFFAHVADRNLEEEIATFLPNSKIDFIAGGGLKFFTKRKDKNNLLDSLNSKGYDTYLSETTVPIRLNKEKPQVMLLAENGMPTMLKGRGSYLPDYTQKALEYLTEKNNPFFLLIEGSQIDWAGHLNDSNYLLEEMQDFDQTLGKVLDYSEKHPNTLVIVTADHETGGFSIASIKENYNKLQYLFTTKGHTSAMVPVFAVGPGSEQFSGIMENTDIHARILQLLKID